MMNARRRPWISSTVPIFTARAPRRRASTSRSRAIPRDALTRTTSPGTSRGRRTSWAASASATRRIRSGSSPASRAPSAIPPASSPTTTSRSATRPRGPADLEVAGLALLAQLEHLAEDGDPPAAQAGQDVERGEHRRRRRVVAVVDDRHVAETDELAAVRCARIRQPARRRSHRGRSRRPPRRPRPPARCGRRAGRAPGSRPSGGRPGSAARSASRPDRATRPPRPGRRRRRRTRRSTTRAAVRSAIRRTRSSSALRTAVPSGGSASTSRPFSVSIASIEPIRARWTGWTAVTTPIRGRPIRTRSAISPSTYIPISRTSAWSAPVEAEDGQRQADLVVLVALVLERPEAGRQDRRDGLLGRGLGDAPGDPDGERVEPPAPGGGQGLERGERPGDPDDADVADRRREGARPADEEGRGAGLDGRDEVVVAVGPLAGQGDEQVARLDPARVDGGAADRSGRRPLEPTAGQPGDLRRRRTPRPAARGCDGGGASVTAASVP